MHNLIIYGGTFDPIHSGHIETALNIQKHFNFSRFLFLPCKIPLLKSQALATASQRVKMIELAIEPYAKEFHFEIDHSELNRDTPSYMVESLKHFRTVLGKDLALTLLIGEDTFSHLTHWYQWTKLIELANILIIKRAGFDKPFAKELNELINQHESIQESTLKNQAQGSIFRFDAGAFDFSSTWIRQQIRLNNDFEHFLPQAVVNYIKEQRLYLA